MLHQAEGQKGEWVCRNAIMEITIRGFKKKKDNAAAVLLPTK